MQTELFTQTKLMQDFEAYCQNNRHVWKAFERLTFELIDAGRKSYGARGIVEVIRFETAKREVNSEFKINNDTSCMFARVFMIMHPEHEGFFKLRTSKYD